MGDFNVATLAELLSAVAAFLTVGLAFVELSNRSKAKKADIAMDIYSDFLCIKQQLEYSAENVCTYTKNIGRASEAELVAFAKAHQISPSAFTTIQKLTKESISSFDCMSADGQVFSKLVLDASVGTTDLLLQINSFFCAYGQSPFDVEKAKKTGQQIGAMYQKLQPNLDKAGEILKGNLIKTQTKYNLYLAVLLLATAVLLLVCTFL